jgi:hypothetical protein
MKVVASILVADPKLKPWANFLIRYSTMGTWNLMSNFAQGKQGGLWVGGDLNIDDAGIQFGANILNSIVNENGLFLKVPKEDIVLVSTRPGLGAGIVDFNTDESRISFKVWRPNKTKNAALEVWGRQG